MAFPQYMQMQHRLAKSSLPKTSLHFSQYHVPDGSPSRRKSLIAFMVISLSLICGA
jgi:hypothetical protein